MITAAVVPWVVIVAMSAPPAPAGGPPAPLSTSELKQRLADAQARIWAWEVEYESVREDRHGTPAESYIHRIVAAKAPDRFFHWSAHGTPWLDWRDDPYQQRLTVNADRSFIERPLHRLYHEGRLRPDEPLPGSAPTELLLTALGWWPLAQRPAPTLVDRLPAALPVVARSPEYRARPAPEQVGGRWCHVLECPGRDRLWLDVERGCAVVARQIDYPDLTRIHRVEFGGLRELQPGVWAPSTLRNLHYVRGPDGTLGKVILDATLNLLRVRLNDSVDDARFVFKPLPGSVGAIDDRPFHQTVPGGEGYLDEVADWVSRDLRHFGHAPDRVGEPEWVNFALGLLLGGGAVTALFWGRFRAVKRQVAGTNPG